MNDWAVAVESRNFGVKRRTDRRNLWELLRMIAIVLVLGAVLCFQLWVRGRMVDLGYQTQVLRAEEQTLLRAHRDLVLEEATLKSPERIDAIARNELGMMPLRPAQLLPPAARDAEAARTTALAYVRDTGKAAVAGGSN